MSEPTITTTGLAEPVVYVDRAGFGGDRISQILRADRAASAERDSDPVNHPAHYTWLPLGIEVIDITELFNFRLGNTLKYILRSGRKKDGLEDLRKARWYLDREIAKREGVY